MSAHFNTSPDWPQTREEVERLDLAGLFDFMAMCDVEPADYDGCLACYAYELAQEREAAERGS